MLYVYLKNKLISADAAAPIIAELKARWPNVSVTYVVPSAGTMKAIEQNVVLLDALKDSGRLAQFGRRRSGVLGWIESRVRAVTWLLQTALRSLWPRTVHMHFGTLEHWPFRLLFYCAPKRVLMVDSAFHGFTERMTAFANLNPDRGATTLPKQMTAALAFHDQSQVREAALESGVPYFQMSAPHGYPAWKTWLDGRAPAYLQELAKARHALDKEYFITFILGFFGKLDFLADPHGSPELFEETIDTLSRTLPDVAIVLKPHTITDMDRLQHMLAKFPNARLVVSNLHPALLAMRSYFVISNYYSTTQSTAAEMGIPTVEYTQYSPIALAKTGNESVRPDHIHHFIQRDQARLASIAASLVSKRGDPQRNQPGELNINDGVFSFLATGRLPS